MEECWSYTPVMGVQFPSPVPWPLGGTADAAGLKPADRKVVRVRLSQGLLFMDRVLSQGR